MNLRVTTCNVGQPRQSFGLLMLFAIELPNGVLQLGYGAG